MLFSLGKQREGYAAKCKPGKTAHATGHWFPREMTSEEQARFCYPDPGIC